MLDKIIFILSYINKSFVKKLMKGYFRKMKEIMSIHINLFRENPLQGVFNIIILVSFGASVVNPYGNWIETELVNFILDHFKNLVEKPYLVNWLIALNIMTILFICFTERFPQQKVPNEKSNIFFRLFYNLWEFCYYYSLEIVLVGTYLFLLIIFIVVNSS